MAPPWKAALAVKRPPRCFFYDNASDAQAAANKATGDAQTDTTSAQTNPDQQLPSGTSVYVTNTNVAMYVLATNEARTQQDIANCI